MQTSMQPEILQCQLCLWKTEKSPKRRKKKPVNITGLKKKIARRSDDCLNHTEMYAADFAAER